MTIHHDTGIVVALIFIVSEVVTISTGGSMAKFSMLANVTLSVRRSKWEHSCDYAVSIHAGSYS